MKDKNVKKISILCLAGSLAFSLNIGQAMASPYVSDEAVAGISKTINEYYDKVESDLAIDFSNEYGNLGIANVSESLNIRQEPGEDKEKVGKLSKDAGCEIIEVDENGWAHIKSGDIEGYVDSSYLLTGEEAGARAKETASLVGTVIDAGNLRLRESASIESNILDLLSDGEEVEVVEVLPAWTQVKTSSKEGYVSSEYLDVSYKLNMAVPIEEEKAIETSLRSEMVAFANQYLGGRYVWGGTTLGVGVDCSGFTQAIYNNFGYSIPRVSRSQASGGTSISSSDAKPGDLFFYGEDNYISHVAMYIGNEQVIHASDESSGIKISNAYYRTPIQVVKYIND